MKADGDAKSPWRQREADADVTMDITADGGGREDEEGRKTAVGSPDKTNFPHPRAWSPGYY